METWSTGRRALAGVAISAGLGALAGGMECVALAASERLALGPVGFALLGLAGVGMMALLAAGIGLLLAPVHALLRSSWASTALTLHVTGAGALLCGYYLWQGALTLLADGRAVPAAAMAAMPIGFAGVVFFNARYFLRRAELGRGRPLPWGRVSGGGAVALVLAATVGWSLRDTGGTWALDGDRSAVIVSIDGWSRPDAQGPALTAVTRDGVWFADAVTPSPDVRAANATLLTGLHPLRHRVLDASTALAWTFISLPELLEREGYATGAFVSTDALGADSGLEQGFRVYDDDFAPLLGGLHRLNLAKRLGIGGRGRTAAQTLDRFEGWLDAKAGGAFLAWVQLPEGAGDAEIGRIAEALAARGAVDDTLLVVVGTRGIGARGAHALYDDVVRVPLAIRAPGAARTVPVVDAQVRLMDVAITAIGWLAVEPVETEGVDLLEYASGRRSATMWSALVGRADDGSVRVGLRNNGLKYIKDPETGAEELYHLAVDPPERDDLTTREPDTLAGARTLLAAEEVRLLKLLGRL